MTHEAQSYLWTPWVPVGGTVHIKRGEQIESKNTIEYMIDYGRRGSVQSQVTSLLFQK